MNIEDYQIVKEYSQDRLVADVKTLIELGWEPIGGVSTCVDPREKECAGDYSTFYCQAMIKTKP